MSRRSQDGLAWEETLFDLVPCWAREPTTEAIERTCRQKLNICPKDTCSVGFYSAGAFNKLFLITCTDKKYLMRVSLPVHPHTKTRGEVATLRWVRDHTKVTVPQVIVFEDNNTNEIGFEWILMDLMPGSSAYKRWRTMSMDQKVNFTTSIAEFQADLFRHGHLDSTFRGVGTLDLEMKEQSSEWSSISIIPGELVSQEFFRGGRINYDVPRGPFRSSYDWLDSMLKIIILEHETAMEKAEEDDDKEDAAEIIASAQKLISLLPTIFSPVQECAEATILIHDDLNLWNILTDSQGKITAVVDWECVSALPIWMATRMPKFLAGGNREEEPKRDAYADETPPESAAQDNDRNPRLLDNEGKNQLYWIHTMEWEVTQLRKVYSTRLRELWPDWPVEESYLQIDFYEALLQCSAGVFLKKVNRWVDSIERGHLLRWTDA
jgi:aminoglycoside phosphotransferase (APT) family kinase protein